MIRKKILYIHHGKGLGGAPLSLLYLINALDKTKFDPVVLFLHNSEVVDLYKAHGIEVAGVVNLYDFSHTKIWWFRWYHVPYFLRSVYDLIKTLRSQADLWFDKINPDIVHLNTSSLIAWGKIAHKRGLPVIWHIREPLADGYTGLRKKLVQLCVKKYAHTIVSICKNDAKPWQNCNKIHVVYNAVDRKRFDFKISSNNFLIRKEYCTLEPRILFLGGLSKEKGTEVILKVFNLVLQKLPNTRLLVAGYFDQDLKSAPALKRLFPSYQFKTDVLALYSNLKNSIDLIGATKQIPEVMTMSDVVVFPATVGHFARPVIEAGFMKKPVIASDFPPLDELVLDGATGFLIHPNDIAQWAKKLILLLTDHKLNRKMGEAGYVFCSNKFTIEMQIKKIESIYTDINVYNF